MKLKSIIRKLENCSDKIDTEFDNIFYNVVYDLIIPLDYFTETNIIICNHLRESIK